MGKKLIIASFVSLVILLIGAAVAFYGLKSGGFLERHIASLVEERPGDKFSFNGISPNFNLSLTVNQPMFMRQNLQVWAKSVTIKPSYTSTIFGSPAADWFKVEKARIKKGPHELENIQIEGSCPQMKGGLVLEGTLKALFKTEALGKEVYGINTNFYLAKEELELKPLELKDSHQGLAKGEITYSGSAKGKSLLGFINFGQKGPRFGADQRVYALPRGRFQFDCAIKDPSELTTGKLKLPLAGTGLSVHTPKGLFTLSVNTGTIDYHNGSLLVDNVTIKSDKGGSLNIGGGASKVDSKDPTISLFANGNKLPLPALLPFLPADSQAKLANLSSNSTLDVSASLNGPMSNLQGSVTITPQNLSLDINVMEQTVPINLVHGGLRLKLFSTPQKLTVHSSIDPPAALHVAGSICAFSGVVKDLLSKKELDLSLSATQIELTNLLALAPAKTTAKITKFSPTGFLTISGRVRGEAHNPQPDVVCTPTGLGLQIPLKDGVLPIKLVKGRLHLKGQDLFVDDMLLETLQTPISFTGEISDLKEKQKLDLTAKVEKAPITKLLNGLPPSLKPNLGKTKGSLGGFLSKAVLSIGGTFRKPHIYGWLDLAGISAKHSAFKNRSFYMQKGRVSLQSTGDAQWKDLRLTLGKVILTTAGKFVSQQIKNGTLKVFLPLTEVPLLLGLQKSLKMTGNTSLQGKLSGAPASIIATGTLVAPGKQTMAFLGAKRPFYVDSANLRSAWRFDGKSGELTLPAISASFLGGQLSAKAKVALLAEKPQHWMKMLLKGVDLNRLMTRGANMPNLLFGLYTCTAENYVSGKKGVQSLTGEGVITINDMAINGGTMVDISGWDRYFPSPQKKHRSIGRALLHGLAEVLIERSGNKALQGYAAIREVLRREHRFGTMTATVKTKNGVINISPISTTGANSTMRGKMTIRTKDLVVDGLFSGALVYDNKYLAFHDIAVKGSASAPQFKLTKSVLDTFVMKRLK